MKVSLRALRVNRNMSQAEACKALKIGRATLYKWETNSTFPNLKQLARICEVYRCRPEDIFLPSELTKS